jgi:hypothetical protein
VVGAVWAGVSVVTGAMGQQWSGGSGLGWCVCSDWSNGTAGERWELFGLVCL